MVDSSLELSALTIIMIGFYFNGLFVFIMDEV